VSRPSAWRAWPRALLLGASVAILLAAPVVAQEASPQPSAPSDSDGAPSATTSVAAIELEAAIPTNVAGLALETVSFSGEDIVSQADGDDPVAELEAIAADAGVAIGDLLLASGTADDGDRFIGILAARLGGLPASEFRGGLTPLLLETTDGTPFVTVTVGDDEVTQVGPGTGLTGDALVYLIERGDTAWYIVTELEMLSDALDAIP
jgi:hypothetical protein